MIKLLERIGLVYRKDSKVVWPLSVSPWWLWKAQTRVGARDVLAGRWPYDWLGIFRNKPGVIKWVPGRLLPWRWGFYILGFEVGDRGGSSLEPYWAKQGMV